MSLAPVLLFTYKKVAPVKKTLEALKCNFMAKESDLIIFSDGAKNESDAKEVSEVRAFLYTINGFKSVEIYESVSNKGLANSIIEGVTQIIATHNKVIVLEDDLVTSPNFLNFMNEALNEFVSNNQVHSVSGYTMPINPPKGYIYDSYFTRRASSWGWATWKNRWEEVDWQVKVYNGFKGNTSLRKKFNAMGSDLSSMLDQQMQGKISSWAIRWCFDQFLKNQLTVFPVVSKISNIGFGSGATHTKYSDDRFATILDTTEKTYFNFNKKVELEYHFIKQFRSKYSLRTRAVYKIKNLLGV